MEIWVILMLLVIMTASNIVCLVMGAKIGQQVAKGQPVKVDLPNPVAAIKEHREEAQAAVKQSQVEAILRNIDRYDGSSYGQEEIR